MKLKNITICVFLWSIASMVNAQAQKSLVGFQDIPWGSSVPTVKGKFTDLKAENTCTSAPKENQKAIINFLQSQDIDCTGYSIKNYVIDGINFRLRFEFNLALQLKDVSLEMANRDGSMTSNAECQTAFTKLGDLLSSKYGQGYLIPIDSDPKGFKALGFSNHDAKYWNLGATNLYLSKSWGNAKIPGYCWLILTYSPSASPASKL